MKTKSVMKSLVCSIIACLGLISCQSEDNKAKDALTNMVNGIQASEANYHKVYCRGSMRDAPITKRIQFEAAIDPMARAAEENGEGYANDLIEEAMEKYDIKTINTVYNLFEGAIIDDQVASYPGHEEDCKIIDVKLSDGNTYTYFIHKVENDWYVVTSTGNTQLELTEDLYQKSVFPKEMFSDKRVYNPDYDMSWQEIETNE